MYNVDTMSIPCWYDTMLVQFWYDAWSLIHRWSGRNHREKISTQVAFDEVLDIKPFCDKSEGEEEESYTYNLMGVIIHHGRGFGSGHYTACCWNAEASKSKNKTNCLFTVDQTILPKMSLNLSFRPWIKSYPNHSFIHQDRVAKKLIYFNHWLT